MSPLSSHRVFFLLYTESEFSSSKHPTAPILVLLINIPSVHLSFIQDTDTKIHFNYTHNCEQNQSEGVASRRHLLLFTAWYNNFMNFSPRRYSRKTSRYFRASFALYDNNPFHGHCIQALVGDFGSPSPRRVWVREHLSQSLKSSTIKGG